MSNKLQLQTSIAYQHGKFVPFSDAHVSIASSPMLYGLAIYTVFSANWNEHDRQLYVFRLRAHYDRLCRSARIMDFQEFGKAFTYEQFEQAMLELLRRNHVAEDALVRAAIYVDELAAGTRIRGLANDFTAFVYPLGEILKRSGIHAGVSSWTRTADNMMPSRAKVNGSYINASLMKNEALANGYDEAIALDVHGHVTEGTVANLFLVRDGRLITPDTAADILEGITRGTILHVARDLNIPVDERSIDRSELYVADEAMMVGSSAKITPILSIDRRPIGSGKPGPLTKKLADYYDDIQHGRVASQWLTSAYQTAKVA